MGALGFFKRFGKTHPISAKFGIKTDSGEENTARKSLLSGKHVMEVANLSPLNNIRHDKILFEQDVKYRSLLNERERQINDSIPWLSWEEKYRRGLLKDVFGSAFTDNYHGAMVNAAWIEIPPAVRYEIVRYFRRREMA